MDGPKPKMWNMGKGVKSENVGEALGRGCGRGRGRDKTAWSDACELS